MSGNTKFSYRYLIKLLGTDQSQTINHVEDSESDRIVSTWTGLDPQRSYTFIVTINIQEVSDPGALYNFSRSTTTLCPGINYCIRLSKISVVAAIRLVATWGVNPGRKVVLKRNIFNVTTVHMCYH